MDTSGQESVLVFGFSADSKPLAPELPDTPVEAYSALLEKSPHPALIVDFNGNVVAANHATANLHLYADPDSLRGRPVNELIAPECRDQARSQLAATAQLGYALPFESKALRSDGTTMDVELSGAVVMDSQGKPAAMLGIARDISARKRDEEQIRKLSQAVEQSPVTVVITDAAGTIEYVNPKFTQLTGYTAEEALGKNPRILKSGDLPGEVYRNLWETIANGREWLGELHNRKKNGELFWEMSRIGPIKDGAGRITHYLAIKEDITERKLLEAQLRQSQKMEGIGRLAGGMAHEFNNILASIMMHIGLAQVDSTPAQTEEMLQDVMRLSQRAAGLIKQLLAFSRQSVMRAQPLDWAEGISRQCGLLRKLLGEGIVLDYAKSPFPAWITGDASLLEQVLLNLCLNARDAMPSGGRIQISLAKYELGPAQACRLENVLPGPYLCLTVADNGCGMDDRTLKRLFEPFFTTKDVGHGTGLGLATARGIIQQQKGWIAVESQLNQGSTFRVYLPAIPPLLDASTNARSKTKPRGAGTILVVEDDVALREPTSQLLTQSGYVVIQAANAKEAMEAWANQSPAIDLLYSDVVMPGGFSGLQLAEKLLADKPGLRVILSSGYNSELPDLSRILSDTVVYLPKPLPPVELLATIRRQIPVD